MFIYFVFPSISFYLMSAQFWILLLLLIWHGKKKPLMYLLLMMILCLPLTVLFNLPLSLSHWSAGNSSMLEGVQSASTAIRLYWLCATNRIDNQENCESYQTAKAQNNDQKMNLADGNFVFTSLCVCGALSLSLFLSYPFVLHTRTHTHILCVFLYSMFSILYTGIPFLFETIFVLFRSESPFSFKHFLHSRNSLPFENIPYSILFSFFRVWGFVEAKILSLFSLALARIHSTGWNPKVH